MEFVFCLQYLGIWWLQPRLPISPPKWSGKQKKTARWNTESGDDRLREKSRLRNLPVCQEAMSNPEIRRRSEAKYSKLSDEI